MSINVNEDVIGSGGLGGGFAGGGYGGVILIAIILVLVVMGGGFFNRGGHDAYAYGHHGYHGKDHETCADKMTWSRYANYEDPQIAKIQTEVACATGQIKTQNAIDTGQIKTQNAIDTGVIIHALDQQTCDIKMGEMEIIQNQQKLAMDAERMFYTNQMANLRDANLELKGKILQQETVNTIHNGNCQINHRLDQIECGMVKHPPFYAAGGSPYINPFNFQPTSFPFGERNGNCCG